MCRRFPALAIVALAAGPALAGANEDAASLGQLRDQDLRVATIAFRLATSGVALCSDHAPQSGMIVHDVQQYGVPLRAEAVRLFGFAGRPAVEAVVPGGPAEQAGIRAGDGIAAVDGAPVAAHRPDRRRPSYAATAAVLSAIDAALARGRLALTLDRGGTPLPVMVRPIPGCLSAVQVQPDTKRGAWSDGRGVVVTSALAAEAASDDELAALIGHEMAHNILHHRDRLDAAGIGTGLASRIGAKAARVRETEDEADYVGVYLAARAGYDPAAAAAFWQRYGQAHGDGFMTDSTHPGWRQRVAALAAAAAEIRAKQAGALPLLPDSARAPAP